MILKKIFQILTVSVIMLGFVLAAEPVSVGDLQISHYWAKPGISGKNTAAYLVISNPKNTEDKLIKVECDIATSMELHDHINDNGVMKMRPVDFVAIKDKEVSMKPGSLHIMFMGLKKDLKEGDGVKMKLTFDKAGPIEIDFQVKKPA